VPVQRCIRHKERNVLDHLPERDRAGVKARLRRAWRSDDHAVAREQLHRLTSELERSHPGAATSLNEGLEETLTITASASELARPHVRASYATSAIAGTMFA
jgi:transposase-like protein